MNTAQRMRLDSLLVHHGHFPTRSRARDAILRGTVTDRHGAVLDRPGMTLPLDYGLTVADEAAGYVSRAALKLRHGLDHFGLSPERRVCLDLGASTGGFTQVLLERGARKVFSVDVGHAQMAPQLRDDPRVVVIEGLNARNLTLAHLEGVRPQFIACDLSFISLKIALPPALGLAADDCVGVFLVKPQFELGKAALRKSGIVRDEKSGRRIAAHLQQWLSEQKGWTSIGICDSPLLGGDGNREFLLAGRKQP